MTPEVVAVVSNGGQVTPERERELRRWWALGVGASVGFRVSTSWSFGASLAFDRRFFVAQSLVEDRRSTAIVVGATADLALTAVQRLRFAPTLAFDRPDDGRARTTPWLSVYYGYCGADAPAFVLEVGPGVGEGLSGSGELAWQLSLRSGVRF